MAEWSIGVAAITGAICGGMKLMEISNYEKYTSGMKKSIRDKLFFEGLVDSSVNTLVDFGCADGQVLAQVKKDFPEWKLIGIDNDETMLKLARDNCPCATYYKDIPCDESGSAILNLSSVIHEVYSYSTDDEIIDFWQEVFESNYHYISVRDIMVNSSVNMGAEINDIQKVKKGATNKSLADFTSIWGDISSERNLLHYLLKYRYVENWDREVRENYLPITVETFLNMIPDTYEIVYFNHYVLPFNRDRIREDFGIELKDNTHIKILLKHK